MAEWKPERRITRGKGDTEKKEPRALHKAAWVWGCYQPELRVSIKHGKTQTLHIWCGERHKDAAAAKAHADFLNAEPANSAPA
jgi:hypothetical protein